MITALGGSRKPEGWIIRIGQIIAAVGRSPYLGSLLQCHYHTEVRAFQNPHAYTRPFSAAYAAVRASLCISIGGTMRACPSMLKLIVFCLLLGVWDSTHQIGAQN